MAGESKTSSTEARGEKGTNLRMCLPSVLSSQASPYIYVPYSQLLVGTLQCSAVLQAHLHSGSLLYISDL